MIRRYCVRCGLHHHPSVRCGRLEPQHRARCGCVGYVVCCKCGNSTDRCFPDHYLAGEWKMYMGHTVKKCKRHVASKLYQIFVKPSEREREALAELGHIARPKVRTKT